MLGVVCRVLLVSSLALGTQNDVTLELATPAVAAPDGVLLCATDGRYAWARDTVAVASLAEGGTLWDTNSTEHVAQAVPDWRRAPWFSSDWALEPLEVAAAADVLGADPYYASSYTSTR
jgi:hypothetical protein